MNKCMSLPEIESSSSGDGLRACSFVWSNRPTPIRVSKVGAVTVLRYTLKRVILREVTKKTCVT